MTRNLRFTAVFAILLLSSLSTFAQNSPSYGTSSSALVGSVIDVDEGRGRLQIASDSDPGSRITVETDTVATQYRGFGTVIGGKPEIFTGSKGFSNLRIGDRVEVRGSSRAAGVVQADTLTLLGREVAAAPTGVGQTRSQTTVSTPVQERDATATAPTNTVDGTIRQITNDNRILIQTPQRRMMTVRTYRSTPVVYRGQTYQVSNLEVGDIIRVEIDPRDAQLDEVAARRIEVTRSVQDTDTGNRTGGVVTVLAGGVTRAEPGLDYVYVDDGRGEVRVDMSNAEDANGNTIRARDLRAGDRVEITGSFNRVGDLFAASTVRFTAGSGSRVDVRDTLTSYSIVTITAVVTETLEDATTLGIRDRDTNRALRLWVTDDFLVRTKSGTTTTTAGNLRVNDTILLKAYRDPDGNLLAQTIKLRNR
jgi:hypothetical protein